MKPAKISKKIISPLQWQDFSGGEWLMQQEQQYLNQHLPGIFGYHLLKLGHLSCQMDCRHSMIRHHVNIAPPGITAGIAAELTALPIQESCIDLCLLHHTLDFASDPHQILREVERVLTSDGYIILSGFNPMSLMGIRGHLGRRRIIPWACRMFTPMRVKDWLHLLGFEVIHDERYAFTSFAGAKPIATWVEQQGRQYCRPFASAYLMVAHKRTIPLTPVQTKWQVKRSVSATPLTS
ncbi:class I SAM-dependent methyltransferase [Celerinatantimonas sp. YJH-8]|uniref:class I SAM-dependent methyltransferase n=1 Tax=Celerinatantimonas sp. YJH-8 TaxID=3228714 RepID=UPI0038BECBC9